MNSRQFFYDLGKSIYRIDAVYGDFAKESSLSPTLLWILYALNDGKLHTQREICIDWELPKSTVNTAIKELEQGKYVELVPITGKRREMTIVLTEQGKKYANSVLAEIYKKEKAVFGKLSKDDLQVVSGLEKITTLLKELKER